MHVCGPFLAPVAKRAGAQPVSTVRSVRVVDQGRREIDLQDEPAVLARRDPDRLVAVPPHPPPAARGSRMPVPVRLAAQGQRQARLNCPDRRLSPAERELLGLPGGSIQPVRFVGERPGPARRRQGRQGALAVGPPGMATATPLGEVGAQVLSEQPAELAEDVKGVLGDIDPGAQPDRCARGRLHRRQQPAPGPVQAFPRRGR